MNGRTMSVATLIILAGVLTGCVQRTISLTSRPTGALVYLNDEEVGRTPVTVSHLFHGVYSVRLELDGHKPLWTKRKTEAPWWEMPGPDLVAEMFDARVEQKWHFDLEPVGEPDLDALGERADQLRQQLDETQPTSVE
jgi:hypothetical protein